jgi:hypothetical protein
MTVTGGFWFHNRRREKLECLAVVASATSFVQQPRPQSKTIRDFRRAFRPPFR